jgi:hypothetical protein
MLKEGVIIIFLLTLDPWLRADTSIPLWDMLPLVTR